MTAILLCLALSLALSFLAGCRFATVLHRARTHKRGGYIEQQPGWPKAINGLSDTGNL